MPTDDLNSFVMQVLNEVNTELQMSLDGMTLERILWRPSAQSNNMAWIAWHIARLQDARAAALAGSEQLWVSNRWHKQFGLAPDQSNTGRGHTDEEVDAVGPTSVEVVREYAVAASEFLVAELGKLSDLSSTATLGGHSGDGSVRDLVFRAVHGGLAHVGQLMYVRGLVEKRHWFPR